MTKNDLITALEARNMDTTGTKPILHARLRKAYQEEAWAATEPPAEENKLSAAAEDDDNKSEDDGSAIAGDDGEESGDDVSDLHQRPTDGSPNDESSSSSSEGVDDSKWQRLISQEPEASAEGIKEPVPQDDGGNRSQSR
jgi:hypothetical protein